MQDVEIQDMKINIQLIAKSMYNESPKYGRLAWELLYADDLAVTAETEEELFKRLNEWKENVESKGMRVDMNETKITGMISGCPGSKAVKRSFLLFSLSFPFVHFSFHLPLPPFLPHHLSSSVPLSSTPVHFPALFPFSPAPNPARSRKGAL